MLYTRFAMLGNMGNNHPQMPYNSAISLSETQVIKGVAVLMMVFHHCFGFPTWYVNMPEFFQNDILVEIARIAKFCVSIFAFLTGWTYFHNRNKTFLYSIRKISLFMLQYWMAFALCAFIAVSYCSWHPCFSEVIGELLPISQHPVMKFVWYVTFYIQMMLLLPILYIIDCRVSGNMRWCVMAAMFLLVAAVVNYVPKCGQLAWFIYAMLGYYSAKERVIEHAKRYISKRTIGALLISSCLFLLAFAAWKYACIIRIGVAGVPGSLFSPVLLIGGVLAFPRSGLFGLWNSLLAYFGKHSMNVWFVHGIFFSSVTRAVLQKYLFFCEQSYFVFIEVALLSLLASVLLIPIQRRVCRWFDNRLFRPL